MPLRYSVFRRFRRCGGLVLVVTVGDGFPFDLLYEQHQHVYDHREDEEERPGEEGEQQREETHFSYAFMLEREEQYRESTVTT